MEATIIDRYRKIQNGYQSTSKKQTDLYELKRQISLQFGSSIDYEPATKVNDTEQQLIVVHTDNEFKKNVIAYPDSTFSIGNTVDCYDMKWLITKVDANKQVYTIGEMSQCNLLLKWQNSSGVIIERYAVVEKPTNTSLNDGTVITTSEKKYQIKLPYDSETQNLFVDKRFLLEKANGVPLAYRLSSFDGITSNYGQGGILSITLTQDEYNNATDSASLMIADYYTPVTPPTGTARITFSGSPNIYMGGSYKTFTGSFVDSEGVVIPDVIPVWTWTCISGDESKYTVVVDGSTFKIKALYFPDELIGSTVTINLADSEGLYSASLEVEVIDLG